MYPFSTINTLKNRISDLEKKLLEQIEINGALAQSNETLSLELEQLSLNQGDNHQQRILHCAVQGISQINSIRETVYNSFHQIEEESQSIDKINELNSFLPNASKDETLEIKHQIIPNKRDYIKDMNNLIIMKRQKLETKKAFFENIKNNIKYTNKNKTNQGAFMNNKSKALERAQKLDLKIIEKTSLNINEKSKYFKQYETNKNAIEKLKIAIKNHPMNEKSVLSNNSDNKLEAISNYIYNIETEIAVLENQYALLSEILR